MVVLFNDPSLILPSLKNERNISFLVEHGARALDNALRYTSTRDMLYIDELSGLFNYRYLKVALEREIKRADRYSTQLSVVFLDLDNFKGVNDTYGHLVGSNLLRELGLILKKSVREVDVLIRYGGDEYTIILVETGPDTAKQVAERIRHMIATHTFSSQEGYQVKLTASLGFACYPDDTTGMDELLAMADKAMYAGKAAGKNCVYRIVSPLVGGLNETGKEL
jgi:diguanylate cyclase (GGDEF)-like protein